jgi:hypothetical protein
MTKIGQRMAYLGPVFELLYANYADKTFLFYQRKILSA